MGLHWPIMWLVMPGIVLFDRRFSGGMHYMKLNIILMRSGVNFDVSTCYFDEVNITRYFYMKRGLTKIIKDTGKNLYILLLNYETK